MRLLLALLLSATALPALAQPTTTEGRVGKLEKEMRAVQRKVFPGGAEQFVEPDIRPATPATAPAGVPAAGALIDLTARVDSLERQLQQITAQSEQNGFRLKQLEDGLAKLRADTDGRFAGMAGPAPATMPAATTDATTPPVEAPRPARPRATTPPRDTAPPPTAAVEPPAATAASTGDPAEDAYLAGYRLWEQKNYADAAVALRAAAKKYPKHRRYSYAQNLLGRAYLDDGKPGLAAQELYANYRTMPRGERAQDSLYYLGAALVKLKKNAEACRVYDELRDVYGETVRPDIRSRLTTARADAKCGA